MTPEFQTSILTKEAAKLLSRLANQIEKNPFDTSSRDAALAVATAIKSGSGDKVTLFLTDAEKRACIAAERNFSVIE